MFDDCQILPLRFGVINRLAQALMLVEAIENVEFHVLDDLIEAACELMENLDIASRETLVQDSRVELLFSVENCRAARVKYENAQNF